MIVDKNKFLEELNRFDQVSVEESLNENKNFSKEIVESLVTENKNTLEEINERLIKELKNYDTMAIYQSLSWFKRMRTSNITLKDITKFFTNKKNNLISIKTDLILLTKKIQRTDLFLNEELENNKSQLTRIVVNLAKLTRSGEELKNLILDTSSVEDFIALELGNKKLEKIKNINDDIETLTIAKTIITQNISFMLVTKKNIKTFIKSIDLLINVTIPKWDETFSHEMANSKLR